MRSFRDWNVPWASVAGISWWSPGWAAFSAGAVVPAAVDGAMLPLECWSVALVVVVCFCGIECESSESDSDGGETR